MIFLSFFILSVLCLPGCAFNKAKGFENGYYWSDAPEFYKLVSIILIYLKMPVYVGKVI